MYHKTSIIDFKMLTKLLGTLIFEMMIFVADVWYVAAVFTRQ